MSLLKYLSEVNRLKTVTRSVFSSKEKDRKENVAEHTWSMSVIFWYLESELLQEFPGIDIAHVYELIQMHDIVEIYAGDVSTWVHMDKDLSREDQELESMKKVKDLLPEVLATRFESLYLELEKKSTLEAKVVKGIDRISPAIQRYVTGQGWRSEGISEEKLDSIQVNRLKFSSVLSRLYKELKTEAIKKEIL